MRKRSSRYDAAGNLEDHEVWADIDGEKIATMSLHYDASGFVEWIVDTNGFRVDYAPDDILHQLPKAIFLDENPKWNALQSTIQYDVAFQLPVISIDINGQKIEREYDEFGRFLKLWGPYEPKPGEPSIEVNYSMSDDDFPAYAVTLNRANDPATGELHTELHSIEFIDGLTRSIQTQADAEVAGVTGRFISGNLKFDSGGRIKTTGEPVFSPYGPDAAMPFPYVDTKPVNGRITQTEYDALDRLVRRVLPGNRETRWIFTLSKHPERNNLITRQTIVTDPNGGIRHLHYDPNDRLVAITETLNRSKVEPPTTIYRYAPTGDLLSIVDAIGTERSFEYDLAGRRIAHVSTENGRYEYQYDPMGNLTGWTDENLCDARPPLLENCSSDRQRVNLLYDYTRNRLLAVDFPNTQDTIYRYGDQRSLDDCNSATQTNIQGRICRVQDGGGLEFRGYGKLGRNC